MNAFDKTEAENEIAEYELFGYRYLATIAQANRVQEFVSSTEAWHKWHALNMTLRSARPSERSVIDYVLDRGIMLAKFERELFLITKRAVQLEEPCG